MHKQWIPGQFSLFAYDLGTKILSNYHQGNYQNTPTVCNSFFLLLVVLLLFETNHTPSGKKNGDLNPGRQPMQLDLVINAKLQ